MNELVVNFTPTGMVPTKEMTPHIPLSVAEIVAEVRAAVDVGITMVHLHARDPRSGAPAYQAEIYGELIGGIREFAPELVICVSLSGREFRELDMRAAALMLEGEQKPDMGSLTLSSMNFTGQASINEPGMIQDLAMRMKVRGILPELEAFDTGMVNYAKYLIYKGILEGPHYFNLLLGGIAGAQADLLHAGLLVRDLPDDSLWSLAGLGDAQLPAAAMAMAAGGGVRVGLEDNIYLDRERGELATNVQLLERVHALAAVHQRQLMSSVQLRQRLALRGGNGAYGRGMEAAT